MTTLFTAPEIRNKYGLDMVEAESIRMIFVGIARQMHESMIRSAFSMVVRDLGDCSANLHMITDDGIEMISTGEGAPLQPFTSQYVIPMVIEEWGQENLSDGDVLFLNDPYRGCIHQADAYMIRPIFWEGKILFYSSAAAHLIDVGGPHPGAFWPEARDVYGEGLRVPPMLCYSKDVPVRSFFNLFLDNTRAHMQNLGDIRSIYGCLVTGERLVHQSIRKYGLEKVLNGCRYSLDYGERCARSAIAELPDGEWTVEDYIDDDGLTAKPIKLVLTLRKRGDSIELDGSGTERQGEGYLKSGMGDLPRAIIGLKQFLDPDNPVSGGLFRAIDITVPPGSQFLPLPPSPCSNHMEPGNRVINMGLELLGKAVPEKAIGADCRTNMLPYFAGYDTRKGREGLAWGTFTLPGGGWGGYNGHDGLSGVATVMGNSFLSVWEYFEQECPLICWGNDLLIDSGGAGKFRGGLGNTITIEWYSPGTVVTVTGGRVRHFSPGAAGGGDSGACYGMYIKPDGTGHWEQYNGVIPPEYIADALFGKFDNRKRPDPNNGSVNNALSQMANFSEITEKPGIMHVALGGGAGWGNPLERDVEQVRKDVWNELVSIEGAESFYGVVIDPANLQVNKEATDKKRRELGKKRERGTWSIHVAHSPLWLK